MTADAPQPTDDGLAVVAEIGGDFNQVTTPPGEEGGRPNGLRRRRSRRGRRDRFAPRFEENGQPEATEGEPSEGGEEATPSYGEPELGGVEAAAGMDHEPASIAEALEPPPPIEYPLEAAAEPAPAAQPEPAIAAAPEPEPEPEAEPEPAADEPPRPRRTGWWSRAKSTLVGE